MTNLILFIYFSVSQIYKTHNHCRRTANQVLIYQRHIIHFRDNDFILLKTSSFSNRAKPNGSSAPESISRLYNDCHPHFTSRHSCWSFFR